MLKCAVIYKNGLLKLTLLPKACLDDCYYLFTNFVNEVTHRLTVGNLQYL